MTAGSGKFNFKKNRTFRRRHARGPYNVSMEDVNLNQTGGSDEVYYTLATIRKTLGISRSTLWRLCKSDLPTVRIGAVVRVKKVHFDRFLKSREIHPQSKSAAPPLQENVQAPGPQTQPKIEIPPKQNAATHILKPPET